MGVALLQVMLCIHRYEFMGQMCLIWLVGLIVARQTVCYTIGHAIHMLDGKIKAGNVFPPSRLSARQMGLSLKVFEALVVCNYEEFSS